MHLYAGKKHQKYILNDCPNDQLLFAMGIRNGLTVSIVTKQPIGGPIIIRIKNREIAIDKALACHITAKAVT